MLHKFYSTKYHNFVAQKAGKLYGVTFYLDTDVFAGFVGKSSNKFIQDLLHFRLGHLNVFDTKKLILRNMVCGLYQTEINTDLKFCESYVYDKQTKTSFPPNKRLRSKRVLELIHADVSGPMSEPAWDRSQYFVTFMDDFTRASMIYCIEHKSDVFERFKQYAAMAKVDRGCKISKVKADNRGKYISNEFKHFCRKGEIDLSYTVPYNPQMNSVSERLNRTLQEEAIGK